MNEQEIRLKILLAGGILFFAGLVVLYIYLLRKRNRERERIIKEAMALIEKSPKKETRDIMKTAIYAIAAVTIGYFIIQWLRRRR